MRSPSRLTIGRAAACALAACAAPVGAQQAPSLAPAQPHTDVRAAAPRRPDYQTLRFEERWDARPATADAFDALKHVALGGRAFVTVAGQERARSERVRHLAMDGDGASDAFALQRLRVSADLHVGDRLRFFGELRDSRAAGRDLPGGARPQDDDRRDAQNAFGELSCCRAGARAWAALRVGRQEMIQAKERLVSPGDWTNAPRTFQGVRGLARLGAATADAFTTHPVLLDQRRANGPDVATRFSGVVAGAPLPGGVVPDAVAQLYAYDLRQRSTTFAGVTGGHRRETLGARVAGRAAPWLAYETEGAWQFGTLGAGRVAAWMLAGEATATAARASGRPSASLGIDVASGDRRAGDAASNAFHPLFGSSRAFMGGTDLLGRVNAGAARATLAASPHRRLALRAWAQRVERTSLGDGAYTSANAVLRPADGSRARHVGDEGDLAGTLQLGTHLRLAAGYAHFRPGAFLRESARGARAVDWGYAATTFTF